MSEITAVIRPEVSVVIAVYNVENFIAQCCYSLFSQTLDNIEYIFVNDCSTDKSLEVVNSVLQEYPHRVHQVKIIEHPINLGVSRTREDGVKAATGEYIIHCDPDDWVELDMYEQLYSKARAENADIVLSDIFYYLPESDKSYYAEETPKELTGRSILASCLCAQSPILHCYLWNKLIRSDYYQSVTWYPNISLYEDLIACAQILQNPLKVSYINHAFYHYRQRKDSLAHKNITKADLENDYTVVSILYQVLCSSDDAELWHYWQACTASHLLLFSLSSRTPILTDKEYQKRYRKYREYIFKDKSLSRKTHLYLYCTTYNYYISFFALRLYRRISSCLRKIILHHR